MKKDLSDVFNRFARRVQHEYPKLKDNFILLDVENNIAYGNLAPEKLPKTTPTTLSAAMNKFAKEANDKGSIASKLDLTPEGGLRQWAGHLIAYKEHGYLSRKLGDHVVMFSLFHELGHHVVKDALTLFGQEDRRHFGEVAADIYALIRLHQQTSAAEVDKVADSLRFVRTVHMIEQRDDEHYTSLAINKFMDDKSRLDLANMTPNQAADLAWRYACKYSLPNSPRLLIRDSFQPYRDSISNDKDMALSLRKLAEITLANQGDAFRAGMTYLSPFVFEGQIFSNDRIECKGTYWDDMRDKLKLKAQALTEEGILFNMPLTNHTPANQNFKKVSAASRRR